MLAKTVYPFISIWLTVRLPIKNNEWIRVDTSVRYIPLQILMCVLEFIGKNSMNQGCGSPHFNFGTESPNYPSYPTLLYGITDLDRLHWDGYSSLKPFQTKVLFINIKKKKSACIESFSIYMCDPTSCFPFTIIVPTMEFLSGHGEVWKLQALHGYLDFSHTMKPVPEWPRWTTKPKFNHKF